MAAPRPWFFGRTPRGLEEVEAPATGRGGRGKGRGGRGKGKGKAESGPKSAEDLDAELESYRAAAA